MAGRILSRAAAPPAKFIVDGVATWWITWTVVWTSLLIIAMLFLYAKRHTPVLRARGLPLSFAAITLLHTYWVAVQLGYSYGHLMPAYVEFWIMSIWLPFGIAMFHASNTRFLYVAREQRRYIGNNGENLQRSVRRDRKTLLGRYRTMEYTQRMLVLVGIGMMAQLFLTLVMFLVSKKFHPSFGVEGTEVTGSAADQKVAASRGWEWWPSVFWQILWAWVFAPIILWRSRSLHDSLGWRFQTIACCLSGLHAAPMWLISIYVPAMAPVNKFFIPPQWIATSIMFLEIFTIFWPCWEVIKAQSLRQETIDIIARWESRNKAGAAGTSFDTSSTVGSRKKYRSGKKAASIQSSTSSILNMDALEHTLSKNPEPLQHFSALRDFSGENIAFLTRVAKWRNEYFAPRGGKAGSRRSAAHPQDVATRECFESALRIYIDFVSDRGAEFQINLSSTDFKYLQSIFEGAARTIYGEEPAPDPAAPFEMAGWRIGASTEKRSMNNSSQDAIISPASDLELNNVRYWGDIPEGFGEGVFDHAEVHIKYLVLTNTWPKFVKDRKSLEYLAALETV